MYESAEPMANRATRSRKSYTKGEINRMIDSLLHPLSKQAPPIVILDGFLHGLVEQNPTLTTRKFFKHNMPLLIQGLSGENKDLGKAAKQLIIQTEKLARQVRTFEKTRKRMQG